MQIAGFGKNGLAIPYGSSCGVPGRTINSTLGLPETGRDDFVAFREKRDAGLSMPRLLLPSLQINIRGGRLPEPEGNGTSYLKRPLNRF